VNGVSAVLARISEIEQHFAPYPVRVSAERPSSSAAAFAGELELQLAAPSSAGPTGQSVVDIAKRYLGVPYLYGGTDPNVGLDCSALVQLAYRQVGVDLPRTSAEQATQGLPVASLADALPGDLVAFNSPVSHIGIYAGDGKMVVAPHTGEVVRIETITKQPTAIRRILPAPQPATPAAVAYTPRPAALRSGSSAYASLFTAAEQRYGLPAGLLDAVARAESSYRPDVVSSAGAIGLMQLMPSTAASLGVDPHDPVQSIDGAGRLLQGHLQRFGDISLALAAYNAGGPAVAKYGGIPPYQETQNYVRKVMTYLSEAK
jgi:soluble lytic murein transglycosylase-like protein